MARNKRRNKYCKNEMSSAKKTMLIVAGVLFAAGLICVVVGVVFSANGGNGGRTATTTTTTAATTTVATTTAATSTTTTTTVVTTSTSFVTKADITTTAPIDTTGRYVQPANAVWYLKLANDWNTLPENYESTFKAVEYYSNGPYGYKFDSRAIGALRDMINAANKENPKLNLKPVSCLRSASYQKTLYWNEVDKWKRNGYGQAEAEIKAATVVKRPGQSEHNTGLAADLGGSGNYDLNEDFEKTASFKWLYENCADYGFILRFPKGKEDITGVIYEPWHYRYVGKKVAKQIMAEGICLEEYLEKNGQ